MRALSVKTDLQFKNLATRSWKSGPASRIADVKLDTLLKRAIDRQNYYKYWQIEAR